MTQVEWQAERARLADELEHTKVAWAGLRARGDWDGAQVAQTKFYALRTALATFDLGSPDHMVAGQVGQEMTPGEWQTEADRIASELEIIAAEWKILRIKGKWDIAREAQGRYHRLRKEQSAHALRMPEHLRKE